MVYPRVSAGYETIIRNVVRRSAVDRGDVPPWHVECYREMYRRTTRTYLRTHVRAADVPVSPVWALGPIPLFERLENVPRPRRTGSHLRAFATRRRRDGERQARPILRGGWVIVAMVGVALALQWNDFAAGVGFAHTWKGIRG